MIERRREGGGLVGRRAVDVVFAASVIVPEDEDVDAEPEVEAEYEDGRDGEGTGRQEIGMSDGSESRQSGTMRMSEERTEAKSRFWGWSTVYVDTDSQSVSQLRARGDEKDKTHRRSRMARPDS